jgi:hypothetical protein
MNKSESIKNLAAALANAQAEMPVAVFDATNPFLKSKYASLGAVIQASRPILARHKLSLVQFPISDVAHGDAARGDSRPTSGDGAHGVTRPTSEMIGVESILTHESGEFVSERILIPLAEEKGKSRVQSAGSTLTYLRRYSWASILGMYSDEDADGGTSVPANALRAGPKGPPFPPSTKGNGDGVSGRLPNTTGKLPVPPCPPPARQKAMGQN